MSVRNLLPIAFLAAAIAISGCAGAPTQAEGTVSITQTTSTTTSTSTTTTTIPALNPGSIATSPSGTGIAFATVFTFLYTNPPSGGVSPYTFSWKFGDGGDGAGASPSHAYMNPGSFVAVATATDSQGKTATASVPVSIRNVTGRWTVKFDGVALNPEPIDVVQNATALAATANSANGFGLATGTGSVSNPRAMSISLTYGTSFAATFVGRTDDTIGTWSGTVTGYSGCPCTFTATRPSAVGDLSAGPGRR
jgi:hypothetical protein